MALRRLIVRAAALACASLLVAACGNVVEHVSISPWQEAGTPVPPRPYADERAPLVQTVSAGSGKVVEAGDLVQVRVTAACKRPAPGYPPELPPQVIWLWTGSEPRAGGGANERVEAARWGWLGSPGVRAALVGRRVGDVVSIEGTLPWAGSTYTVPLHGFIAHPWDTAHDESQANGWPGFEMASPKLRSRVEILEACRGVLLRRDGTLRQAGVHIAMFDSPKRDFLRDGTIRWSALEGTCAQGKVRFEVGPLHVTDLRHSELSGFRASYRTARPPGRYPGDYAQPGPRRVGPSTVCRDPPA